jgi:carboxyl-terminal processing protease
MQSFCSKNEIIVTKSKIEKHNAVYKTNEPVDTEIPLVIIVNGRSASASKLFLELCKI